MKHLIKQGFESNTVHLRNICQNQQKLTKSCSNVWMADTFSPPNVLFINVIILTHMDAILTAGFDTVDYARFPLWRA